MVHTGRVSQPKPQIAASTGRGCLWVIFLLCTIGAVLAGGGLVVRLVGQNLAVRMEPRSTEDPAVRGLARGAQYEQTWKILEGRPGTYTNVNVYTGDDEYHGNLPEVPHLSMSSAHQEGDRETGVRSARVSVSLFEYADEAQAKRAQQQETEVTVAPSTRPGRTPRPCNVGKVSVRVGLAVGIGTMRCGDADEAVLRRTGDQMRRTLEIVGAQPVPAEHLAATAEHPIMSRATFPARTSKSDDQAVIAHRPDGLDGEQLLRDSVKGTGVQLRFDGKSDVYVYADAAAARAALDKQAGWRERNGPETRAKAPQPCEVKHTDASLCRETRGHGREGMVRWHAVGRYLVMDSQDEGEPTTLYDRQLQWLAEA